jgi:uncharacterized protein
MRHAMRAARMATEASPDLIALLGDYALSLRIAPRTSKRLYEWAFLRLARVLATLRARDGIVGVLGNHDYDYDAPAVARWLGGCGVHVLLNECIVIERDRARLAIGGVDDYENGTIDAHGGCPAVAADVPRIVLSHNPDGVLALDRSARIDLVLAGHTHGGQLVLPWFGAPARHCTICDADCASGWVRRAPFPLYVSAGTGALIPLRIGSRPEVLLVRLVRR